MTHIPCSTSISSRSRRRICVSLQYMADHQKIVDWIDPDAAAYQTKSYSYLLKGLQDVGMTFDGAYVTASPAALLRLIYSGLVEGVGLKDADFDLS